MTARDYLDLLDRAMLVAFNPFAKTIEFMWLYWLSFELKDAIRGVLPPQQYTHVLSQVIWWNEQLEALAIELGL